jgi:dynein regulatory complex protein 1
LEANKNEIDQLFKEQKKNEEEHQDHRKNIEEQYQKELEDVRNYDANHQAEQKIKLEKEMQILEKCMEDMKAVYKLNEEKLQFNFRVLQEKIRVNEATIKN